MPIGVLSSYEVIVPSLKTLKAGYYGLWFIAATNT